MDWLLNTGVRLRKLIGVIIILLLLCVFFSLYFFKYIPYQQQLLNGRSFRELEQIGTGLTNKSEAYSSAIHWFLKKRSAGNPLRSTFQFTAPFPPGLSSDKDSFYAGPMRLERNDQNANWQLAYPLYQYADPALRSPDRSHPTKDTLVTEMRTSLSPILQPIITTYKDIFDDYLVLRDRRDSLHNYEIAFSSGTLPVDYRVGLDSLLKKDEAFDLITIHDVTIEGTPSKLFVYPLQLGEERIILAGIIDVAIYKKGYNTIPFNLVVMVGILVLLLFMHLPVLKVYVLGKCERIRGFDIRMIISTYFIAAFLVFFLFSRIFLNHVQSMHNFTRLKDLSEQVEKSFTSEIDNACRQLRQWDTSSAIWASHPDAFYRLLKRDTSTQQGRRPDRGDSSDRRLIDSLFNLDPHTYPYADYVYWIDSSGKWVATWNTKRGFNKPDLLVVKDRSYFKDFIGFNILTFPHTDPPDSFTIQPTLSRLDGEYTVNIVAPSRPIAGRPSRMIGLSTEMYSVCAPLLPFGYNFSIIDGQGNILYDSKPGRALLSNITRETESPSDLLSPLRYHSKRYFSSFILQGRPKALLVTPMKGFPYSLLVYYDLAGSDDFQAHLIGLSAFFGACVLLLLILSSLIKEWFEKRPVQLRTPTRRFEWLQPTHIKERYYRHLIRGMLSFLLLFIVIWTLFEEFALSSEFSLFYISLLFPFYIALHYYLLREKQKKKSFIWPNAPLLLFMGIVIASINIFACWGTRSAFSPLLVSQLAFTAGIIISLRTFHPEAPPTPPGQLPPTPGHWRRNYVLAIVLGVIMINIIPTSSIFWIIFKQESLVQSNTSRLTLAGSIDERRTTVNERILHYKLDLTDHSHPLQYSRDSLDLHRLKFQYGLYVLHSDTVSSRRPEGMDTIYPIAPAYTQVHRWLFPRDSTALAWPANPNYATDSSWVFLGGEKRKWTGSGLLYYNQRDAIENNPILLQTNDFSSSSAFGLMKQETFSTASRFYSAFYFGSILLIGFLLIVLTWSLAQRIFLLDLLKRILPRTNNTGALDRLLHRHRPANIAPSIKDINAEEIIWWKDPVANEQIITDKVDQLSSFYAAVWESFSEMEQFTLYDFALDGFTNYKNSVTLIGLINRHILIVVDNERLKFMTPGFREWILRTRDNGAFNAIADKARQEGYWENIKNPLLLLLAVPGVFIFVTQDDVSQKITGFLTALTPLLPLFRSFFPKKKRNRSETPIIYLNYRHMQFSDPISTGESNKPSRKKPIFPVTDPLRNYLKHHGREVKLPVSYRDLLHHITYSVPLRDKNNQETLWETALYDMRHWDFIREGLVQMYAILKTEGDLSYTKHLDVARIDFCSFANSNPFRIRIVNKFNDNYDHYYIKQADASRIYGLELEHLLSPNRITYFTHLNTLVEEHIPGIPGDLFIKNFVDDPQTNKIRLSKEFVKFNERCFVRLLGDMRSYNFVVDITPDIEDYQYRIRAIDFDQQSYEGRKNLYVPQFFKENNAFVEMCIRHLNKESIEQYQTEERTMMAFRVASSRHRLMELLNIMAKDEEISSPDKLLQLKTELTAHFSNPAFLKCHSMGQLVKRQLKQTLQKNLTLIQKNLSKFED